MVSTFTKMIRDGREGATMVEYGLLVVAHRGSWPWLALAEVAGHEPLVAVQQRRGVALGKNQGCGARELGGDCASQPYPIYSKRLQKVHVWCSLSG